MSNPPNRPPPAQQRPAQQQQQPKQQERSTPSPRDRSEAKPRPLDTPEIEAGAETRTGITADEVVVVEGTDGARNLDYEWIDVWLPGGKPMYIIVKTLPSNDLQVSIEQRSWKKNYAAKGRVQTDVVPIAPIGTSGKLLAKDASTGEELTVSFHWVARSGPSLLARLIKLVKRLFTNAKA